MATLESLALRLRAEIADLGKSFVWQTVADGITNRYEIPHAPVDGATLIVQVDGTDIPDACAIEERTGILTFDEIPAAGAQIVVAGTVYRYFTTPEIESYISTAFIEHTASATLANGSRYTMATMPVVEEYPVIVLASTMALQTLATDASFDIDISAPDGVMIPRSQRYRQLMEMVEQRRAQYRDLCANLNIGLYRVETFVVRRVSNRTNRLSPLYIPQEIDDRSTPVRIRIPIPTYGATPLPSLVETLDLTMYRGDTFQLGLDFPFDLSGYNIDAQIRDAGPNGPLLNSFTIDVPDIANGVVTISLTGDETKVLPERSYWDIQLTKISTLENTTYFQGTIYCERDFTRPSDPHASGWRGTP